MEIDWGSVPDWLAGVGAVAALFFAAIAALAARRTNAMQSLQLADLQKEMKRRDDDERRSLASRVAVYVSVHKGAEGLHTVRFVNGGALPIYNLRITCFTPNGAIESSYFVNGPHPEGVVMKFLTEKIREVAGPVGDVDLAESMVIAAACSFRDAAGRWWYRTAQGELCEASDSEDAVLGARSSGGANQRWFLTGAEVAGANSPESSGESGPGDGVRA